MDTEAYVEEAYTGRTTRLARVPGWQWAMAVVVISLAAVWCVYLGYLAGKQERATTGAYVVLEWGWNDGSTETTR